MKRVLIITGASRGIGLATAQLFAAEGFIVYNLSRSQPPLAAVTHVRTDLAALDRDALQTALAPALRDADQVVLVHNAGAIAKDAIGDFDVDEFRRVLEINVTAPAQLTRWLLPQLPAGSAVIYIGSTLSEMAVPGSLSYVVSKHALLGLM